VSPYSQAGSKHERITLLRMPKRSRENSSPTGFTSLVKHKREALAAKSSFE
jgi:hypothetical protein